MTRLEQLRDDLATKEQEMAALGQLMRQRQDELAALRNRQDELATAEDAVDELATVTGKVAALESTLQPILSQHDALRRWEIPRLRRDVAHCEVVARNLDADIEAHEVALSPGNKWDVRRRDADAKVAVVESGRKQDAERLAALRLERAALAPVNERQLA